MNCRYRRGFCSLLSQRNGAALALRISVLSSAACLLLACSKPASQNRYDSAIEWGKTYSIQSLPKNFVTLFRSGRSDDGEYFIDIALHPSFSGKFEAAAEELEHQQYFQDGNPYLLNGIIADNKSLCELTTSGLGNVDCGDDGLQYSAAPIRYLHTERGDFIFSSADMSRGNGQESNENASPLVVVVDPSDGGMGLILEDHIAVSGGRRDVLAAALTLASSIVRLENPLHVGVKIQPEAIRYDLEAAKTGTLFVKPKEDPTATPAPPATTQNNVGPDDTSGRQNPSQGPTQGASYTEEDLKKLVMGKTMAEVRAALGEPSNTEDSSDYLIWFYWPDKLQVVDSDAGVTVKHAGVLFDPSAKIAVGVTF